MRDLKKKQIRHCNIIPSDLPKWVFLEQMETIFGEMKTISQWKQHSIRNGIGPKNKKRSNNKLIKYERFKKKTKPSL